jgi:IS1 family transposase
MNKSSDAIRAQILRCLTEGMSVRATSRLTGASRGLVLRILAAAGDFAEGFSYYRSTDLNTVRVECDEQWSFVGAKQRNAQRMDQGDIWTYCALDADSRFVVSWLVGPRSTRSTEIFMTDLASRLKNRIQLSTDGFAPYLNAVRGAFEFARVDYARIVKDYGQTTETGPSRRYSPATVVAVSKERMIGRPDMEKASTSYVERLNLETRQNCRRFTRLSNAFSKSALNHARAVALQFFVYNYCRPHGTLSKAAGVKTTPAMAVGLADRVWSVDDIVSRMDPDLKTVT